MAGSLFAYLEAQGLEAANYNESLPEGQVTLVGVEQTRQAGEIAQNMPRWKPPSPKSSPYITPEGARALDVELKALWKLRRQEVVPALSAAAAEGDRSENAEYIYRKKQLAEIDRKVRYLSMRLDEVEIVRRPPADLSRVFFGAYVELEDDTGTRLEYRIVGADETDSKKGFISIDSPLARALLSRAVDDEVTVELPGGSRNYLLLGIRYQ